MNRPPLQLIWDSSDAIATAQRFHAELAHAEHGTRYCLRCDRSAYVVAIGPDGICASCRRTSTPAEPQRQSATKFGNRLLFSRSRERRARLYDGLAVALLMALMACLGVIVFAASAKADPDGASLAYAAEYGGAVCSVLEDGHDTFAGITGIANAIHEQGLTYRQAGEVISLSVTELCPEYTPLILRYARAFNPVGAVA